MGMKKEMEETDNRTVYARYYKEVVQNKAGRCSFCRWHRGENASRMPKHGHRKLNKVRRIGWRSLFDAGGDLQGPGREGNSVGLKR